MTANRIRHLLKKLFTDKHGSVVLWQRPNIPLFSWFVFMLLSKIFSSGGVHSFAKYLSLASLVIWALLEITFGASYFRRFLGLIILAWTISSRL
jgi:hypothetical protein